MKYTGSRDATVRALTGMNRPPKRAEYDSPEAYKAASTRWTNARRSAQRWDASGKAGKQQRGGKRPRPLDEAQRGRAWGEATGRKLAALRRRGMRVRLKAQVRVDTPNPRKGKADERVKTMPSGGPGTPIDRAQTAVILEAARTNIDRAAGLLLEAFDRKYVLPDGFQIEEVVWLRIWPDGEPEPVPR